MKNFLLVLILGISAITISAFAFAEKSAKKTTGTYYWYVIENGQVDGPRLNNTPVDKATAMATLTNCRDVSSTLCIAGSEDPNLDFEDEIPDFQSDNYIHKD